MESLVEGRDDDVTEGKTGAGRKVGSNLHPQFAEWTFFFFFDWGIDTTAW